MKVKLTCFGDGLNAGGGEQKEIVECQVGFIREKNYCKILPRIRVPVEMTSYIIIG